MAANSGGVDWSTVIKPLLSSNYGNLNKADVLNIIKAILKSENDFAEHDYSYEQFYMTFSSLAADTISGQCHLVCQTQVPQMIEASSVLIHYILNRLWNANLPEIKWFLIALKSLCEGKQQTQGFDHAVIASVLKSSKYPEHNKSNVTASDKESPKSEMKRSRSDLSTVILQQLTVPLNSTNSNSWAPLSEDVTDCTQMFVAANIACMQSLNAGDVILNVCTSLPVLSRYRLKYEDSAINGKPLYLPLTPAEATQVKNCYPQMSTDISILAQALTLPVLEPITPTKITQLSQCAMSALYCAVLASISGSVLSMSGSSSQKNPQSSASSAQVLKEADENEDHARVIVDKALEIYTTIGNIFKNSARAHIYQNHLCFGSWLLITGIQSAMGASGSSSSKQQQQQQQQQNVDDAAAKGKSPAKGGEQQQQQTPTARVNLFKVQQGFGVLNAAIASHCLVLLKELIEDLKIESRSGDDIIITQQNQSSGTGTVSSPSSFPEPAGFDILEQYTSLQRVIRVLNSATLQQLLTFLATVSYRKACTLKRVNAKDRAEGGDPISYSDSTTYFNDTLSCSEDSETEEEDSESYLGLWFKETLSPEANEEPPESNVQEKTNEIVKSNLVPAKDEPHEYLDLSAQIFSFLDQSLGTNHKFLNKYVKSGLSEQQMILLANILKDLDRDAARGEPENLSCPQWQNAMIKFSGALGRYLHNLISGSLLNESLQSSLLLHLGVSPWTQDSNLWPLQVYSRTLSVLVQIILLKPTQEKEAACLSVWHRLVNTLVEGVCSSTSSTITTTAGTGTGVSTGTSGAGAGAVAGPSTQLVETTEYEDLNVEHAQLLLFLFHSLNLMQKKSILLLTAGGVIRCAEVCRGISPERPLRDNQLMLLSRLLLFLEYLMKHLYNAPTVLLEQVRWNLFSVITADGNQKISDLINNKTKMMSFCRKEIEDKHKKFSPEYSTGIRPKFYSLAVIDTKVQQEFKLDGLAWNFILCTPDKLKYPLLVDALIDILHVTDICMGKVPFHTLCSVHYCFSLCWKLLLGLPPSTPHVEALMQDKTPNLHSLIWSIRCFNPMATSHYLIVNSLIKQGMYTQYAETLWNKVTEHVSDIRYSLKITLYGLEAFIKSFNYQNPRLSKILLLDALVSHMHALCWADKEGIRPTKSSSSTSTNSSTSNVASNASGGATAITTEQDTTNIANGSNAVATNTTNNAAVTPTGTSSTNVATTTIKSHAPDLTRDDLSKELLLKLLEVCETIRDCVFKTMIKNLSGSIPLNIMENLIAITSSQCTYCTDISTQFLNSITAPDKEIITIEWRKNLNIGGEESFTTNTFPVEIHTLSVIDNHLSETSKHSSYSILLSLKHALKSCIYLMYYLLSSCKNDRQIIDKVTTLLIPLLTDIRTEYVYDISKFLNLEMILNNDIISMGIIYNIYRHSYKLILDYCEESRQGKTINLDENVLHTILKFWETMLDKPIGQQSMQEFFCINKNGSLIEMILSFTNTQMSQSFATKVLQFLEKLFQCTEKPDSKFTMEQLSVCIAELGQIDIGRIKNWLHHILLGPGSATSQAQASSGSSSNAQTPTNMATVSAIPSISDQIVQSSEMVALEDDAMEIDLECSGAAAGGASGGAANSGAAAISNGAAGNNQSLSGQWQGNSFLTNRSDTPPPNEECTEKNGRLLQSITKYIVAENRIPLAVSENLFHALLRLGSNLLCPSQDLLDFTDLLQVMVTLADAAHGKGHSLLFTSAIDWLHVSQYHVLDKTIAKQQQQMGVSVKNNNCGKSPAATALENVTSILRYMGDLLHGLGYKGSRSLTPPWEEEMQPDFDDLIDDIGGDDDESTIEDSDEDSLGNKLCTFSQTQKEFMNQHWYHCHTCNMVNTVGVCSVCARVCHKNHDVSYAKYGNFFCDCGAKEDGSCQALSRRINTAASNSANHQDTSGLAAAAAIAGQSSSSASAAAGAAGSSAHHNLDHIMDHNYGNNASGSSGAASTVVTRRRTQTPPSQIATSGGVSHKMEMMMMMNPNERALYMAKVIEASKEQLNNPEQWKSVIRCILEFFELLMPSIRENCALFSTVGCHRRAKAALERLHQPEKQFQLSDQIMLPTLGSQEGAFENVRMSYSGEQGQTIKQLLSSGLVRRVALCCLSSPHGKRQHLAVSHEKGKVTILQLSALLKQADAAKRKLTLTQLSSAPIPCTVLSLTANPSNEDCLAVCGLKECHILTFSSSGAANEHIVLTPQLETGNFIKRAIWLPGSQTKLALVTADFVKIYELSEDTYSPQYYFLVAVGKIRDCTFVYQEGTYYMLLIASSGYIYYQPLDEQSLAKHGDFYVTNTLELNHPHIKDISGQIGGGGVSIYYSHSLQMLFFSYSLGRSFMAPLTDVIKGVKCVVQLQTAGSGGSGNGGTTTANATKNSSKGPPQPLCQWTEIQGHPGLIFAMMHTSNNPVIFMLKPDCVLMQEIKAQSTKSKIMDMVAIRHTVSGIEKTTLILLCEDGSLRIFTADHDNTNYWLSSEVQPIGNQMYSTYATASTSSFAKSSRKSKKGSGSRHQKYGVGGVQNIGQGASSASGATGANPIFPIDFFEHCTVMPDIEFGGNDLLQIYNVQKLKTRLFSSGMYVASTKPSGFTLDINNPDQNMVITGIRVLIGTQDILRAPQSVTVLGRTIQTPVRRPRWFDIPLTREESLQSDKKLSVIFGRSQDPENVCMLDSVEVYGKTKDVFGWPEETEENNGAGGSGGSGGASSGATAVTGSNSAGGSGQQGINNVIGGPGGSNGVFSNDVNVQTVTLLDKMVTTMLEVLDSGLSLLGGSNVESTIKQKSISIATDLLLLPTPNPVQIQTKCVLATLHGNRIAYHSYKDKEILNEVNSELKKLDILDDIKDIDPEAFYRLVLLTRGISVSRPQALTKICTEHNLTILPLLLKLTKKLYKITPAIDEPCSVVKCGLSHTETIVHCIVEIIYAFALSDSNQIDGMTKYFVELLLDPSKVISHSAKEAMILLMNPRVKRRKVVVGSPPGCSTPTPVTAGSNVPPPPSSSSSSAASAAAGSNAGAAASSNDDFAGADVDSIEPIGIDVAAANAQAIASLEALLGVGGFPQLLDLQQDADDEAIMDIAIALSLQEHDGGDLQGAIQGIRGAGAAGRALQNLQALGGGGGGSMGDNASGASGGGSDDEGSNAATDGSTLRTSPAEHAGSGSGSGGSESGGSGVESIGGTSGRSSTYGDQPINPSPPRNETQMQTSSTAAVAPTVPEAPSNEENEDTTENENTIKLHSLRCSILGKIIENFKLLDECNGNQAIPLMQVVLMLTTDLDGNHESDQNALNQLLNALVERLEMDPPSQASQMTTRTPKTEVKLIILCLISILVGKTKSSSSKTAGTTSPPHQFKDNASFVAGATANILMKSGAIPYCLVLMESFLPYWKNISNSDDIPSAMNAAIGCTAANISNALTNNSNNTSGTSSSTGNNLLKPVTYGPKPDITSLLPQNYIKNHSDIFEAYNFILSEIAVRLPYQVLKLSSGHPSTYDWYHKFCETMTFILCEYMMLTLSPILRRQVRKLLMYICGNKEKFRLFRDGHSLDVHIHAIKKCCDLSSSKVIGSSNQPNLTYDGLVELTEHLRACQEVATVRTGNWQRFCVVHEDVIPSLIQICCYQLDDGVSPIILQLLQSALCNTTTNVISNNNISSSKQTQTINDSSKSSSTAAGAVAVSTTIVKNRQERDKSEESECTSDSKFDPAHCSAFVHQIFRLVPDQLFTKFINIFLLETNITSVRWQAHSLIYAIYENSNDKQKERLIKILWDMWPILPAYGRRISQFVDILGYLTLSTKTIQDKLPEYTEKAVTILQQQNELLSRHPNAPIYTALGQVLELDGFYLESEPCLVCNNPEVPMSNIKIQSIKSDSKFTTTTMIVKLVQCHTISKIILRIADLKRTKMVRTINVYYNNRTVQAVVELKNKPSMWHKARKVTLQSGQTDVKIDFPLPITACNLMIEYADFYETVTGSSENLQCPRCSAAVPAYPGVCGNCGENVFQCHKCRAINYDEKDPFLCHSCGFCKYAKFDYSIYGRACCAVDPIESAEDRTKTVQTIHSSLEKADRIYRQLQANKQFLELLIQKISEHKLDRTIDESIGTVVTSSQVNKVIQLLAQKYCVESKTSFEELSKVVQKVKACRRELVAYDRSQMDLPATPSDQWMNEPITVNRCYGCALASTEQCLTLLRAMASNLQCRIGLCEQGLVEELAQNNLRRGTTQIQEEVRQLLCLLTRDLPDACRGLLSLIRHRVEMALNGVVPLANLDIAVRHEMALLESLNAQDDSCWELKLKIVFELFLMACKDSRGPAISVIQPCLRIIQSLICPPLPTSTTNKDLTAQELTTLKCVDGLTADFRKWLGGDERHSYTAWRARMPQNIKSENNLVKGGAANAVKTDEKLLLQSGVAAAQQTATSIPPVSSPGTIIGSTAGTNDQQQQQQQQKGGQRNAFVALLHQQRMQTRRLYLIEKYGRRWRNSVLSKGVPNPPLELTASWLQPVLFNTNSRFGRQLACALITSLSRTHERRREILNLLTDFLKYVGEVGEASAEFLALYRSLADETPWKQYLSLKGVLTLIANLLTVEIEKIHRLEETTLSSDLAQGYALRQLVELMSVFLENSAIRQAYKTKLLGPVLQGYLSLRKLVVQRTRLIDDAQEKLLEMLEEMTSGTEEETRGFMAVLIDTVQKTPINDIKTPVFIFERLYSIIHPEENDDGEFFLTLEKDPQQEDFLQGRMLGNPYPSTEAGLGPLMRDVKNKICTDCELIALLEDDNGMELLVNNKIISLDLPVKEVYKRIWLAEGGERDAMRVVYRMRGLLGDATEEFVETLNNKSQEEVDNEQLYRMANVLADCNGLKVMLDRISNLQNISRTRELVQVLLKLFLLSVKVRRCQEVLCQPELGAINILLKVLQMCLQSENDQQQSSITEQLLEIMETILSKAASDTLDSFLQFSLTFGGPEYVTALISCTNHTNVRNNPSVLRHLIRVLAALVYGNEVKMALLCEHFKVTLDFNKFDAERTNEDEFKMELFCVLTNQIEHNSIGGTLKDYIIGLGIVGRAIEYIEKYAPCVKPTLLRTDSDELKEFISRPSLKYILRFLTGLATKHEATQIAVSKDIIPIIHRLEQVSSDEHVGSLAENLLEALCTDPVTAKRVQEVREFTRAEKKRLAMATRVKQLDALGMRTNEKGQVTAKGSILQKIEKLRDETGLTCFICREGYACQPSKVLGIYTFTKRTNVEEFELKPRKTLGYTTVTHFNVVHVDCHTSAIRLARGRDEWERASLQNANTRCNGLLPLWGPDVSESAFSACMTRHSSYMQESTQRCDITFSSSIHDLKLLLMRFAWEKSFHEDAGGGGPQSNMHLVPYLLFYSLYMLLSLRTSSREDKALTTYLGIPPSEKWLECSYEVEGPLYQIALSLALHSHEVWNRQKIIHLKRLLIIAQSRHISPNVVCKALLSASDRQMKDYNVYKAYLMMWGLIDLIYCNLFKTVTTPKEEDWPISLFDYIRRNDEAMLKSTDTILTTFTEEYLPCTSFGEFCDVAGLLNDIENPDGFLNEILQSMPTTSSA